MTRRTEGGRVRRFGIALVAAVLLLPLPLIGTAHASLVSGINAFPGVGLAANHRGSSSSGTGINAATCQTGESCPGNEDTVWWNWTAPDDGWVRWSTRGSNYDTILVVYTGSSLSTLEQVAYNDDDPERTDYTSTVRIYVTAGTKYYFQVDSWVGLPVTSSSQATLRWGADFDTFTSAKSLGTTHFGTTTTDNDYASCESSATLTESCRGDGHSVWFTWTAPTGTSGKLYTFDTQGSTDPVTGAKLDTTVMVGTGSTYDAATNAGWIADEDDIYGLNDTLYGSLGPARLTFAVTAGTLYRIQVDTFGATGNIALRWSQDLSAGFIADAAYGSSLGVYADDFWWTSASKWLSMKVQPQSLVHCVTTSGTITGNIPTGGSSTFGLAPGFDGAQQGLRWLPVDGWASYSSTTGQCTGTHYASVVVPYQRDDGGPVVTGVLAPPPNAAGWNNTDVTVTWSAADGGVGATAPPTPATSTVTADGVSSVSATAKDALGNSGTGSVTVRRDAQPPTITGSASVAPNAAGWNNTPVTVTFSCADQAGLSGVLSCDTGASLGEGSGQSVHGVASDVAGNVASTDYGPVNIDWTAPVTALDDGAVVDDGVLSLVPFDALSGIARTFSSVDGAAAVEGTEIEIAAAGVHSVGYWSVDVAGNVEDVVTSTVVVGAADGPVAVEDRYDTDEDTLLTVAAPGVLGNDTAAVDAELVAGPSYGSLTLNPDGSFAYTPAADYNGPDSFSYQTGGSDLATVTLLVAPVNDAPVAVGDAFTTDEDTPLELVAPGVLSNDSDVDGDVITAVVATGPAHGTLSLSADGAIVYTPAADYVGSDGFTYRAVDTSTATSEVAAVALTVSPVNDPPVAAGDAYATDEDTALVVDAAGVLANDSDADSDALSAVLVAGPAHGIVALQPDGSLTYTPAPDFSGTDGFTYRAHDGTAGSAVTAVTIAVRPVNDAPTAVADAYDVDEDATAVIEAPGVLANDADVDGDELAAALVAGPAHGVLDLHADGSFSYAPAADFHGADSFTYTAGDGALSSGTRTVALTVNPVNDPPVATGDAYSTDEDTVLNVAVPGVLANDTDVEGDALSASLVTGPAHGTLTLLADGSFEYAAAANFHGADSFTYRASDGTATSDLATVTLTVAAVNDAPAASADTYATDEDVPLTVALPGVLANDTDVDGDVLSAVLVTGPAHGSLALNPDGSFSYTPAADFNGVDGFTYRAKDSALSSGAVAVSLTVRAVNDAPVATGDSYLTDEDSALAAGVLSNDGDVDGDALTAVLVSGPSHGLLSLGPDGAFSYAPAADFNGADSFSYRASDGSVASTPVVVTLTVKPVNDGPVAAADSYATDEDTALVVAAAGVLGNDADIDGDVLRAVPVTGPMHGTLSLRADGSLTYAPAADFNGADSFTYAASDGSVVSAPVLVSLTVRALNDAPVATADSYSTDMNRALTVAAPGVVANDTDVEGDALSAVLVGQAGHGVVVLAADGSFAYTPAANFYGADSFTYRANDGAASSGLATVSLTVRQEKPSITGFSPGSGFAGAVVTVSGSGFTGTTFAALGGASAAYTVVSNTQLTFVVPAGAVSGTVTVVNAAGSATSVGVFQVKRNGRIAFSSERDGNAELYTANADGTGLLRLTTNTTSDTQPAWSPDGTRIAFATNRDKNAEVYVMNANGTGVTRLTNHTAGDQDPSWSPDGTKIAFTSDRDKNAEIYVMNANGSGVTRLTNNAASDTTPAWSPDGKKIAFTSTRAGNPELYVMDASGANPVRLTTNAAYDSEPSWSPDGTRLAFVTCRDGNTEVYVLTVASGAVVRLTSSSAVDMEPAWSPDGSRLAFVTTRDGNAEVYSMRSDGTSLQRVTVNVATEIFPDWQVS